MKLINKVRRRGTDWIFLRRKHSEGEMAPMEFYLLPKYEKNLYQANYSFIKGQPIESVNLLLENIRLRAGDFRSYLNLNFIISQSQNKEWADEALVELGKIKKGAGENVFLMRSIGNLKILLDKPDRSEYVDKYLKKYILPSVNNHTSNKPIFFWHIPKCAGTSFSAFISNKFFKIKPHYLSSYDTELLHKFIIENKVGVLPFISSNHLTIKSIDFETIKDQYLQVAVLRDPVKRAISSWRQYYQNPAQRLSIIQQHGSYWNYFPKVGLSEWAGKTPERHSNAITGTFSKSLDRDEAVNNINQLDLWGFTTDINDLIHTICKQYQLEYKADQVPNKLNATNKNISFEDEELKSLKANLKTDIETYNFLKSC